MAVWGGAKIKHFGLRRQATCFFLSKVRRRLMGVVAPGFQNIETPSAQTKLWRQDGESDINVGGMFLFKDGENDTPSRGMHLSPAQTVTKVTGQYSSVQLWLYKHSQLL